MNIILALELSFAIPKLGNKYSMFKYFQSTIIYKSL